jgi:type IV secretion system protein VirD4
VQNIADILVDPEGALERRNHWEKTSHALLVGAILHVLYAEADKTLAGVANFLSDPKRTIEATLRAMMTTLHLADRSHPVVASAARELLNKSENERSGVLSTAMSFLASSRPGGCKGDGAMRLAHWRPRRGATPATLYLVVPPSDISRTKPLIRLVLNQIGRRLTEDQAKAKRRRLLLMLDEFPALGRLDFFESALAFMAGYGLKSLIAQSLNQIEKAYGQNNSILDNCHVRVAFATNDERTAKRVSDALGVATELRAMKNYAGHRLSPWLGHLMVSRQETARPLLTAGEVMQLPPSDEVVLVSGTSPIRAKKVRYFEDRRLTDRVRPPLVWGQAREHKRMGMTGWRCQFPHLYQEERLQRANDNANGGIRREPALSKHEAIVPEGMDPTPTVAIVDDQSSEAGIRSATIRHRMCSVARQVAMDRTMGSRCEAMAMKVRTSMHLSPEALRLLID